MTLPTWFAEEWEATFQGRFRMRWSARRNRWQIEQKMARARIADRPISSRDDEKIREVEGYELFAEICPGTQTKCDRCGKWFGIAVNKFQTSRCTSCRKEHKAYFWALGPSLLEHMRKVDPDTGGIERVFEETDLDSQRMMQGKRKDRQNHGEAVIKADWNYLHEIQSVGFTGRGRVIHRDKGLK